MTKRQNALHLIRIAGYHDDKRAFMRLYVENRIALPAANEAFRTGQKQKAAGMKCGCQSCAPSRETTGS